MHEVIRRIKTEAETDVIFETEEDKLNAKQKKALKNNKAAKLINGLIDRGVVKRTVMTSVYGVTYIGARQQIQEKIEEKVRHCICKFHVVISFVLFNANTFAYSVPVERERI